MTEEDFKQIEAAYEDALNQSCDELSWDAFESHIPALIAEAKEARELLKLAYENIQDDFDNKPGRHQMGRLSGRIKFLLRLGIHAK